MSVVLLKGQSEFVDPWWAGAQEQALHNFPKFQHCSPVQSLPRWPFKTMTFYTKTTAYSNNLTPSDYYLFWNLIMMVSAIHDEEWLQPLSLLLEIGSI